MTFAIMCGAGIGVGLWLVWRGLFPAKTPLAIALANLDRPADLGQPEQVLDRVGKPLVSFTENLGLRFAGLQRDLAITDRTLGRHLAEKLMLLLVGVLLPPATTAALAVSGFQFPILIPLWASLILGVIFFFTPDIGVKGEAMARRRDFRHVLGSFLDLVVIGLAGGAGVESALEDAAEAGDGWGYARLRQTLAASRVRQETPWRALGRLGVDLGISDLVELSASVGLAGTEGAKVRESLIAKATAIRMHQLTDAEAEAQSMTEKMSLPSVLLLAGFLIFIGFPAVSRTLTSL